MPNARIFHEARCGTNKPLAMFAQYDTASAVGADAWITAHAFEPAARGRGAATLVWNTDDDRVPLVRTTTAYRLPSQPMSEAHRRLAQRIVELHEDARQFNNVLAEVYDRRFRNRMAFHSDQACDLADPSCIAIFACYQDPDQAPAMLHIEPKDHGESTQLTLTHNWVTVFSTDTNDRFRHTIKWTPTQLSRCWVALTFRLSRTFVEFRDERPYLGETEVTLATPDQKLAFYQHRHRENHSVGFRYADFYYTINPGDLLKPRAADNPPRSG